MNKATGANRGDQRRDSAPSRADDGAGAEMISERSRSQREHNCRPDGSANLLPRCANSTRVLVISRGEPSHQLGARVACERRGASGRFLHLSPRRAGAREMRPRRSPVMRVWVALSAVEEPADYL